MGLAGLAMVTVQPSQFTCVGIVVLTNIAVLTVPTYIVPQVWPIVPLSNHYKSVVHAKMATCVMELV